MIDKKTFVETIETLRSQFERDVRFAENMNKCFPNAFDANLLPDNERITTACIFLLEKCADDKSGWINYFIYELNFGQENWRLPVTIQGEVVPLSTPEELYDILNNQ